MYIFGVLLLVALSYADVNWDATGIFKATKEQNVPLSDNSATGECSVDLSYDAATDTLQVDVDCGVAGLGSPISLAHIHKVVDVDPPVPLVVNLGGVEISLVPPSTVSANKFTWQNVSVVDFICNDHAYLNIHCVDPKFNVRSNLVGMTTICGNGAPPATSGLTSWGPDAPEGQMKPWGLKVDLFLNGQAGSTSECNTLVTLTNGLAVLSGSCDIPANIVEVGLTPVMNSSVLPDITLYPAGTTPFSGKAFWSFPFPCPDVCRDGLCTSVAGSPTQYRIEVVTDTKESYWGDIDVGQCPAITAPPKAPMAASSLSFTVYLTVLLALITKWLF